jgi:hypothetical protein
MIIQHKETGFPDVHVIDFRCNKGAVEVASMLFVYKMFYLASKGPCHQG